jgi:hypothetical protein
MTIKWTLDLKGEIPVTTLKPMYYIARLLSVPVLSVLILATVRPLGAQVLPDTTGVMFKTITGDAEFSTQPEQWQPLRLDSKMGGGSVIRTHEGSTVDFYLDESKTTLRLMPDSKLAIKTLKVWRAGGQDVTDTELNLLEGGIVGAQKKLMKPSHFQITTTKSVAFIVGTEYLVRADGAVTVLSGSVSINYNLPGNGGSVKVDVPAGQSFNPATGTVVPTTPAYLKSIIADVNTVKNNANVYKAGGATVVVKPDQFVSPTSSKGNNGVGNGVDPQPPGNPPVNDGPGTSPGNPGNKAGANK